MKKALNVLEELEESLRHRKFIPKKFDIQKSQQNLASKKSIQTVIKGISHRNKSSMDNLLKYLEKESKQDFIDPVQDLGSNSYIFDRYGEKKKDC